MKQVVTLKADGVTPVYSLEVGYLEKGLGAQHSERSAGRRPALFFNGPSGKQYPQLFGNYAPGGAPTVVTPARTVLEGQGYRDYARLGLAGSVDHRLHPERIPTVIGQRKGGI